MSKGNMLLGQARGKVGDVVFFVRNGIQQTRPRNREPKNPRTISQMYQRVKLASVVGFYKRQASFFRFALKKSQKESYYNAFVRYNINISPYLTKEQAAMGVTVPAPYIIADGNMPRIYVTEASIASYTELDLTTSIPSSIKTWGDMRRAFNLLMGDMLSLVVFNAPDDELDPTHRIVVQHRFDTESDTMPIGYDMVGTSWYSDGERVQISVDATYFNLIEFYATGSAIVLSRNNGAVDCSYAQLELDTVAEAWYNEKRTEEQREIAALSYGKEESAVLDPKQFEGNYVEFINVFGDSARTMKIDAVSIAADSDKAVYVDPSKIVGVSYAEPSLLSGSAVLESAAVTSATGNILLTTATEAVGFGVYRIDFPDDNNRIIASIIIKINIEN